MQISQTVSPQKKATKSHSKPEVMCNKVVHGIGEQMIMKMIAKMFNAQLCTSFSVVQDEKALYDAAARGDVPSVRRLIADDVNVDCTPYQVLLYCLHLL